MALDALTLKARADEILDAMPTDDGRPMEERIREAVALARVQLSENGAGPPGDEDAEVRIVPAEDFASVQEPGAEPLVGADGEVLIPESGDVMFYGDGGASKTTLAIDLAVHLAAGDAWLDVPVPRPARVLIVEAEGPRALFRRKLRRKLDGWAGSNVGDRLYVLEAPWADFRFPDAQEVAAFIGEREIDVLVVGPLTRVGWDALGTLQQVRDFMGTAVAPFRSATGRRLTIVLVHHENKGGAVSGAWEGAGDTLFHAQVHARGRTKLTIQKARWSGEWHKRKLELNWTEGEGFEVAEEEERDLEREIAEYLAEHRHRTANEIGAKRPSGIGASKDLVRDILEANPERFASRTGSAAKALGRSPNAVLWDLGASLDSIQTADPDRSAEGEKRDSGSGLSLKGVPTPESLPLPAPSLDRTADPVDPDLAFDDEEGT